MFTKRERERERPFYSISFITAFHSGVFSALTVDFTLYDCWTLVQNIFKLKLFDTGRQITLDIYNTVKIFQLQPLQLLEI